MALLLPAVLFQCETGRAQQRGKSGTVRVLGGWNIKTGRKRKSICKSALAPRLPATQEKQAQFDIQWLTTLIKEGWVTGGLENCHRDTKKDDFKGGWFSIINLSGV